MSKITPIAPDFREQCKIVFVTAGYLCPSHSFCEKDYIKELPHLRATALKSIL